MVGGTGGFPMNAPIVAEALARAVTAARGRPIPAAMREAGERLLIDIGGLCVAARATGYVRAALASWDSTGDATVMATRARSMPRAPRS